MPWMMGTGCACGWAYEEISETYRKCVRCGRTATLKNGYWSTSKPTKTVETLWERGGEKHKYQHEQYQKDLDNE